MKKTIVFITVLLATLFFAKVAAAEAPALFFSDIASGPKSGIGDGLGSGAIVTIWGKNLASAQGASKVYFKDSANSIYEAAYVYYWTNADGQAGGPADLYSYQKMQEVAFSIPSSAADGAGEIYVEVNGNRSNSLPFAVRTGNIYHVKTTGNDSTGNGSWSKPWKTISSANPNRITGAADKVNAGDIIYAGDGVQEIDTFRSPASSRTSGIRIYNKRGTANNPIALIAYPGAKVLAQGENYGIFNDSSDYWVISKINVKAGEFDKLAGIKTSIGIQTFKGGRLVANEISDRENVVIPTPDLTGCAEGWDGAINGNALGYDRVSGVKIYGNYIHDWGCGNSADVLIDGFIDVVDVQEVVNVILGG